MEIRHAFILKKFIVRWEEPLTKRQFINDLKYVYVKVLRWTYTEYSGLSFKKVVLFTAYEVPNYKVLEFNISKLCEKLDEI